MAWVYKTSDDILKTIKDKEDKKTLKSIIEVADDDTDWNVDSAKWGGWPTTKQQKLRCDTQSIKKIKTWSYNSTAGRALKVSGKTNQIVFKVGKQDVTFEGSDKLTTSQKPFSKGTSSLSSALQTKLQEKGSAYIFDLAINKNRVYNKWIHIKTNNNGEAYEGLKKIWKDDGGLDDVEDTWIINFFKQHKVLLPEVGSAKFQDVQRDGGFMEFIENFVVKNYGKLINSKKDNWNPADIWLIKNESQIIQQIKDACGGRQTSTASAEIQLSQLNAIMRQLWKQKFLMGISLKKIDGKATFKKVNVSTKFLERVSQISKMGEFKVQESGALRPLCNLAVQDDGKGGKKWESDDCRIRVKGGSKSWDFQIKRNVTSSSKLKWDNLKFEPTEGGKGGARMGKASVFLLSDLFEAQGLNFKNDKNNSEYPYDKDDWTTSKQQTYKSKINKLKRSGVLIGVDDAEQAIANMTEVFETHPDAANSKCMQISYMEAMFSLSKEKRDKIGTDMVFYASKEGKRFGPHGKIY